MRNQIKTEAIVLKKKQLPNRDLILTLLSKETGKISVFAKGIKKITSRRLPHIQTANLISAELSKRGDFFYLQSTTLKSGFSAIKDQPDKTVYLYRLLFIVEKLLPENQPEPEIYNLVLRFFIDLTGENKPGEDLLEKYLNQMLFKLGYAKELSGYSGLIRNIEELINEKVP